MDKKTYLAACASVNLGTSDGLIKIVPKGQFKPQDGRTDTGVAYWTMTAALAADIIAAFEAGQTDLVVDYEHATLKAAETGTPNPAAGWISRYVWDDEQGLLGEVKWTDKAKQMIDAAEYRYLSPVLEYDAGGNVRGLHSVALTNSPALDGMALAALSKQNSFNPDKGQTSMNKDALIKLLNLPADADDAAINAALAALEEQTGGKALSELLDESGKDKAKPETPPETPAGKGDEAAKDGKYAELEQKVAALSKQLAAIEVKDSSDGLIRAALSDGRLLPHQEAHARALAAKDPEAFKNFMDGSIKLAALSAQQSGGKGGAKAEAVLSDTEAAVAAQLGISAEDYAKAK